MGKRPGSGPRLFIRIAEKSEIISQLQHRLGMFSFDQHGHAAITILLLIAQRFSELAEKDIRRCTQGSERAPQVAATDEAKSRLVMSLVDPIGEKISYGSVTGTSVRTEDAAPLCRPALGGKQ